MSLSLQFLGAAGTVTGSKHLLKTRYGDYLIDCGLFRGLKSLRLKNREPLPLDMSTLKAVFLTHTHLDHSGYLPLLYKEVFAEKYIALHLQEICRRSSCAIVQGYRKRMRPLQTRKDLLYNRDKQ